LPKPCDQIALVPPDAVVMSDTPEHKVFALTASVGTGTGWMDTETTVLEVPHAFVVWSV